MAITAPRVTGNIVTVTIGSSVTKWRTISITEDEDTADAKAADSVEREDVWTARGINGTVTGFLGAVNNGSTLPALGDVLAVANIHVKIGLDSVTQAFTGYTNVKVVGPKTYDFSADPATFTWNFKSGRLN